MPQNNNKIEQSPNTQKIQTIVLATGNPGKAREFENLFRNIPVKVVLQKEYDVPSAAETGTTFVENAIIKARNAAAYSGLPAIADDSGLEVDCLNGAPGVFSARYSGPDANDQKNLNKLLDAVKDFPAEKRTARYWCILVLMRHKDDPTPVICQKSWEGQIILTKKGNNGFGYDPSFYVPLFGMTAAEMSAELKNRISHRGQAMQDLLPFISKLYGGEEY